MAVAGGVHVAEGVAVRSVVVRIALADTIHARTVNAGLLGALLHGARFRVLHALLIDTLEILRVASSMPRTLQHGIIKYLKSRARVFAGGAVEPLFAGTFRG